MTIPTEENKRLNKILTVILILLFILILTAVGNSQSIRENSDGAFVLEMTFFNYEQAVKLLVNESIEARTNSEITINGNNKFTFTVVYSKKNYICNYSINDKEKQYFIESTKVSEIREKLIIYILSE